MNHPLHFEAALFDLDGTLIDSLNVWKKIDEEFFQRRGLPLPEDYIQSVGAMHIYKAAEYTIARFGFQEEPEALVEEWKEMAHHEYANNILLKEGVKEYLLYLKQQGIKIGLCTASSKALYQAVLENHDIYHLFDAFTSTEEVARGKGFPDVYLHTAKKLNVAPQNCIVFEDILAGIQGAKAANMIAVGVYDEESKADQAKIQQLADYYVYNFSEWMEQTVGCAK